MRPRPVRAIPEHMPMPNTDWVPSLHLPARLPPAENMTGPLVEQGIAKRRLKHASPDPYRFRALSWEGVLLGHGIRQE